MTNRDDFPPAVRQALALRAGYMCSFDGCSALTVGPSDESSSGVSRIGVAAHIHAAAPGGKRYLSTMTPQERKSIDNAIWMCATHGTLIDQDDVTYTPDVIRTMKKSHDSRVGDALRRGRAVQTTTELLALGPSLICVGEILGSGGNVWKLRLDHFVAGDMGALINFCDHFAELPRQDRYVLAESLGDGRILAESPNWERQNGAILVTVSVEPRFRRTRAQDIGEDLKIDLTTRDLTPEMTTVAGVDALPQRVQLCLWHQRGRSSLYADFGTRLAEYYSLFGKSAWFGRLVKLEAIRMASIPHMDSMLHTEETPFGCVERVLDVEVLGADPVDDWLPARISLNVVGIGTWSSDISLYIPPFPFEPPKMPSAKDLLFDVE